MVTDKKNPTLHKNCTPPVNKGMPVTNGSSTILKLLTILTLFLNLELYG
jgi:hypothetical protein